MLQLETSISGSDLNSETFSQSNHVRWMMRITFVLTRLSRQKLTRLFFLSTTQKNDGTNNSWRRHEFGIICLASKFVQYLIASFESCEKRKRFCLQPPFQFGDQNFVRRYFPPKVLVRGVSQSGPNTATVFVNDRFRLAAPAVIARHLRNVDAQIDGKTSIQIFPQPRDIGRAGRIKATHLKADNLRETVVRYSVVRPTVLPESGSSKQRTQMSHQCVQRSC